MVSTNKVRFELKITKFALASIVIFSPLVQNLVDEFIKKSKSSDMGNFKNYCQRPHINSMSITPTDEYDL